MNEDRIVGAGRDLAGKAESALGDAAGSERLKTDGLIDRVGGVFQNGYGQARDTASDAIEDAPAVLGDIVDRGRALTRQFDTAVQNMLGERGPLYLLAGSIGLVGLGLFALSQSRSSSERAPRPRSSAKSATPAARGARNVTPATPRPRKSKPVEQ